MDRTSQLQLDDLDFAHDLALLSQTQQQMQEQTKIAAEHSARLGLAPRAEYPYRKEQDPQSELNQYSLSHTRRGNDRRSRPFHVSGQRR